LPRKLFCELGPVPYKISVWKECTRRTLRDLGSRATFARVKSEAQLPVLVYSHKSLIRRKLGNVDMQLQENKAVNLALAAPCINGVLIRPGETFSFWDLVGRCTAQKGYREGLTLTRGKTAKGIGGGMCQFTNLLYWLSLHSPLEITERHHHDGVDLFPDFGRQVPFGCGTSILYKYLDYRIKTPRKIRFRFWYTPTTPIFAGNYAPARRCRCAIILKKPKAALCACRMGSIAKTPSNAG
jgi:vancomycin resistance protein VanW